MSLKADAISKSLAFICFTFVFALAFSLLMPLILQGWPTLSLAFWLEEPSKAGRLGGIAPVLVSTAGIVSLALLTSFPLALASALYLYEKRYSRAFHVIQLRKVLQLLSGIPSIVFGLFGYSFFCVSLNLGFSLLAGALTLACMLLPVTIHLLETSFLSLPSSLEQAATALSLSRWHFYCKILLPHSFDNSLETLSTSLARCLSETAALLFTAGYVLRMPESVLDSGRSLSVHIYDLAMNVPGGEAHAYASALTLILVLAAIKIFWPAFHYLARGIKYVSLRRKVL